MIGEGCFCCAMCEKCNLQAKDNIEDSLGSTL